MKLKTIKFSYLKLNRTCFKYSVLLKDNNGEDFHYISKVEFADLKSCNLHLNNLHNKGVFYELHYKKIVEIIPQKFDEFYEELVLFFKMCSVAKAELNDWARMRKLIVKLCDSKEITKEEMDYLQDRVTFHFKNQGRALELSLLMEKIKEKKAA